MKKISRGKLVTAFISIYLLSVSVWAGYCGEDTNPNHIKAGRAESVGYMYAQAKGSQDEIGARYYGSSILKEVRNGYYVLAPDCKPFVSIQPTEAYPNSSELKAKDILTFDNGKPMIGHYGIALTGGHLVDSLSGKTPWEIPTPTSGTIEIPPGSIIKHALLYYSGSIAFESNDFNSGDFTVDNLNSHEDVINNGIEFTIGNTTYGPYDTDKRTPFDESPIGSETKILPPTSFSYGTLFNTSTSFWGNRLDITSDIQEQTSRFTITVHPPEQLDTSANSEKSNGGNPAGETESNSCFSIANWSLLVIYENPDESVKQIILKDEIVRAWDYSYIHSGVWERPYVNFQHTPITPGAKFYTYAASGLKAGTLLPSLSSLPPQPICTCGCGGQYNITDDLGSTYQTRANEGGSNRTSNFFSIDLQDPDDVKKNGGKMHRDSSKNWLLVKDAPAPVNGNDWTLFESGNKLTEFPNLYEGKFVESDDIQPITNEDSGMMKGDIYMGHPWRDRGDVTYHGVGNSTSIVEVALADNAITEGETQTRIYFKGDQKDVFKPQARITLRYLVMTIPADETIEGDLPPVIHLEDSPQSIFVEGSLYQEPGYRATDQEDGDLTSKVVVDCNFEKESPLEIGIHTCTYSVTDSAEQTTTETRDFDVVQYTAPTITLTPMLTPTLNEGDFFIEPGYQAEDFRGEDLTANVTAECDFVTTEPLIEGAFRCDYSVADSYRETATVSRHITVDSVTRNPPIINLIPIEEPGFSDGDYFIEPGYTADDIEDGDLTADVVARCNFPAMSRLTIGIYECTYSVTDSEGASVTVIRNFEVTEIDNASPCFTSTLVEHSMNGRAYISFYSYFATGSNSYLGNTFFNNTKIQSLESAEPYAWKTVETCLK